MKKRREFGKRKRGGKEKNLDRAFRRGEEGQGGEGWDEYRFFVLSRRKGALRQ